jgi:multimeric flavodoxin WrbA
MILGLCGSPRVGATEYVLREALKMIEAEGYSTTFFSVRGKTINYCIHCDYCLQRNGCTFKDDMDELYPLLRGSEGIIVASPVYNGGVTAQTKAVIDRTRASVAADSQIFRGKKGMAIAIGGDRVGGQELAIQQIITFFILNGIIAVSGGAFGANIGATFWSKDSLKGVKEDEEGFRSLRKTVKRFMELLNEKDGRKKGQEVDQ